MKENDEKLKSNLKKYQENFVAVLMEIQEIFERNLNGKFGGDSIIRL